jgi:hypothetical protein
VIRGNILMHSVNGRLMSVVIDDDVPNRTMQGLIGVQVHVGGPMRVEYRNWRLKKPGSAEAYLTDFGSERFFGDF